MNHTWLSIIVLLMATLSLNTGCANQSSGSVSEEPLPFTHWFDLNLADTTVRVQLAVTREEMAQGLMRRTELGEHEGMLFVHPRPTQAGFWMKNTPLSLDIGFFTSDGRLLEVYPLFPYDETLVTSGSRQVQLSLEMNQGWFAKNNVRAGARLDLEQVRQALRDRGFDPADFRL